MRVVVHSNGPDGVGLQGTVVPLLRVCLCVNDGGRGVGGGGRGFFPNTHREKAEVAGNDNGDDPIGSPDNVNAAQVSCQQHYDKLKTKARNPEQTSNQFLPNFDDEATSSSQ